MSLARSVSDLGDLAAASAGAGAIGARLAPGFAAGYAALALSAGVLKVAVRSWGHLDPSRPRLRLSAGAPSGHAALAKFA